MNFQLIWQCAAEWHRVRVTTCNSIHRSINTDRLRQRKKGSERGRGNNITSYSKWNVTVIESRTGAGPNDQSARWVTNRYWKWNWIGMGLGWLVLNKKTNQLSWDQPTYGRTSRTDQKGRRKKKKTNSNN